MQAALLKNSNASVKLQVGLKCHCLKFFVWLSLARGLCTGDGFEWYVFLSLWRQVRN